MCCRIWLINVWTYAYQPNLAQKCVPQHMEFHMSKDQRLKKSVFRGLAFSWNFCKRKWYDEKSGIWLIFPQETFCWPSLMLSLVSSWRHRNNHMSSDLFFSPWFTEYKGNKEVLMVKVTLVNSFMPSYKSLFVAIKNYISQIHVCTELLKMKKVSISLLRF